MKKTTHPQNKNTVMLKT